MTYRVVIAPKVTSTVGGYFPNNRVAITNIWNRLFDDLENRGDKFRQGRNPIQADVLFDYSLRIYVDRWYTLAFAVDDVRAEGYLFVDAVSIFPKPFKC